MSRLDELINELCPDGVEYRKLAQIADIGTGSSNTNDGLENGKYPFFVRSQEPLRMNDYEYDETAIITAGDGVGVGKVFHYVEGKYALHQRAYRIHINTDDVMPKFFYYYMRATFLAYIQKTMFFGSVASIRRPMLNKYPVPVPPLPVQSEIVRILDKFTELSSLLSAELTARRKQYEYYRENFYCTLKADKVPLSSLGTLTRGKRFVHADAVETGVPCIHYGELYTYYGVYANKAKSHIREELRDKMRYASKGDVIIVGAGENKVDIGVGLAWEGDYDVAVHDACYTLKHNQNPKYISYFLRTNLYHDQIMKYVSEAKICAISAKNIGRALIPLPPLPVQARIVSILDRFDSLCNDITAGLPAEIASREKQYSFYRDRLLSFKRRAK